MSGDGGSGFVGDGVGDGVGGCINQFRRTAKMVFAAAVTGITVTLAGCATTPPAVIKYVTRDVLVPRDAPCPADPTTIPAMPKRVSEEHSLMPADGSLRERILAAKILEQRTWMERAGGIMRECSKGK